MANCASLALAARSVRIFPCFKQSALPIPSRPRHIVGGLGMRVVLKTRPVLPHLNSPLLISPQGMRDPGAIRFTSLSFESESSLAGHGHDH